MDADLIVMGGGIAGLTTAVRSLQLGRSAIVLEQGTDRQYACNSRISGGVLHVCYRDPTTPPVELRRVIDTATAGTARPDIADAMAQNAARIIDWLRSQGAYFVKGGNEEYKRWVLAPLRPQRRGLIWKGLGADVLLQSLEANVLSAGGQLQRGQRVSRLDRSDSGWTVHTASGSRFRSHSVVIADGGFQGNPDLLRQHISPGPEHLLQRGAGTGRGDGLLIAMDLGAATVTMDRFYGHLMHREALHRDDLWPYPWLDGIATASMVVNEAGHRFVDEGKGGIFVANMVARQSDPSQNWVIFDSAVWRGAAARGVIPPNPNMALAGIDFFESGSVPELAGRIGMDADTLLASVETYNSALTSGEGRGLVPPRTGSAASRPAPITEPPFRAARLVAGITYTMGGVAIDGHARVLRPDQSAIDGLYAAGTAAGGLEGGPGGGYVGGLMKSVMTGLLAAEHAAGRTPAGAAVQKERSNA